MKKGSIVAVCISMHLIFIFLHIHKHMAFVKESFKKQENERTIDLLKQTKHEALNSWYLAHNRSEIKTFAGTHLNMKSARLHNMKRINNDD